MIKVSKMKNVKPFTCDSFAIDEEYVCVKTTYNRLSRERIEEFLPATITHKHEPSMTIIANVQEFISLACHGSYGHYVQGYSKDVVFNKTRDSRGLFTARPEISGPQTAVSVSHILVRNKNEWHTIKYMRDLAEVLISKMGTAYDSFEIAGMDFEQLENMRKMVLQIEYTRDQAAFYKGCSASLDFYGDRNEWNCSFFDEYGNLHRFLANDFESMKLNFEKAVDRIETLERYSAFEHGDAARILDKETGEHIGSFEDIHKAKAFIKNNLAKAAKCGMVDTGENNAD